MWHRPEAPVVHVGPLRSLSSRAHVIIVRRFIPFGKTHFAFGSQFGVDGVNLWCIVPAGLGFHRKGDGIFCQRFGLAVYALFDKPVEIGYDPPEIDRLADVDHLGEVLRFLHKTLAVKLHLGNDAQFREVYENELQGLGGKTSIGDARGLVEILF